MLHVMAELVRDDVRLRKIAGCSELAIELVEEVEVEIHLLVQRTIEGSHGALRRSAAGDRAVAEQHHASRAIVAPASRERACPGGTRVVEQEPYELHHWLFARRIGRRQ